ncbi:MAG: hypothetical protein WCA78_03800 [Rhizomicrobium sp.]|jgi:hypothetical protein
MNGSESWRTQLEECVDLLERTPAAPRWLAAAIGASVAHAEIFAPRTAPEKAPPDFYYPH